MSSWGVISIGALGTNVPAIMVPAWVTISKRAGVLVSIRFSLPGVISKEDLPPGGRLVVSFMVLAQSAWALSIPIIAPTPVWKTVEQILNSSVCIGLAGSGLKRAIAQATPPLNKVRPTTVDRTMRNLSAMTHS